MWWIVKGGGVPYNKNRGKYGRVSFRNAANLLQTEAVCRILTYGTAHKVLATGKSRLRFRELVALRTTRQDRNLSFPASSLQFGKRSFSYFGPQSLNDLHGDLREVVSSNYCSKYKIKEHF